MTPHGYDRYLNFFEEKLKAFCAEKKAQPSVLADAMCYSLLSGGKRVRPVLFFASLEHFGMDFTKEAGLALALECIHTYSLIHDDLPAMDDDDFRRGNPSNHIVFGEAHAILAGDALLSEAFSLSVREAERSPAHLRASCALAEAAGAQGMIAGQSADLLYTGKAGSEEALRYIYEHKTGKLLAAPVVMAAILGGGDLKAAEAFGTELGVLFQLTDDLLDVKGASQKAGKTLGKDSKEDKLTCIKLFGEERSEQLADTSAARCRAYLSALGNDRFLSDLVTLVRERDN